MQGVFFAGSPDTVFRQMRDFYEGVNGFGNFLMMVQGGMMGYDITARSMGLFATEVLPRVRAEVFDAPALAVSPPAAPGRKTTRVGPTQPQRSRP
jgi:hypothetical protein